MSTRKESKMRRKKGLTLLELMLSLFIIAIIAGLGTPVFQYSYRTFFEITTNLNLQGELLSALNFMKDRIKPGSELVSVSTATQTTPTPAIDIVWKEFVDPNPSGTAPSPADMQNSANYVTRRIAWETAGTVNNLNYYANWTGPSSTVSAVLSSGAVNTETITTPTGTTTHQGLKFTTVSAPLWQTGHVNANNIKVEITCSKYISPTSTTATSKKTTVYGVAYLNLLCRSAQ